MSICRRSSRLSCRMFSSRPSISLWCSCCRSAIWNRIDVRIGVVQYHVNYTIWKPKKSTAPQILLPSTWSTLSSASWSCLEPLLVNWCISPQCPSALAVLETFAIMNHCVRKTIQEYWSSMKSYHLYLLFFQFSSELLGPLPPLLQFIVGFFQKLLLFLGFSQ